MKKFNELVQRNYQAVRDRGLIDDSTTDFQYVKKMTEEVIEIQKANLYNDKVNLKDEVIDLMSVCTSFLFHNGYDIEFEFEQYATLKNERRANNG